MKDRNFKFRPERLISAICLMAVIITCSCFEPKGRFGFRTPMESVYRYVPEGPEVPEGEDLLWTYTFENAAVKTDVSVIIQKKEIMWTEVSAWADYAAPDKPAVTGAAVNYPPGHYCICIINNKDGSVIDRNEFTVYSED